MKSNAPMLRSRTDEQAKAAFYHMDPQELPDGSLLITVSSQRGLAIWGYAASRVVAMRFEVGLQAQMHLIRRVMLLLLPCGQEVLN